MKQSKTKLIALNGVVAALYAVLTMVNPLSYGVLQFRLSTLLLPLAVYRPDIAIGLVVGTAVGNMNSSLGIIDVMVGSIVTAIAVFFIPKVKWKWLMPVLYAIDSGVIVSLELYYCFKSPILYNILTVGISGLILYTAGLFLMKYVAKAVSKI